MHHARIDRLSYQDSFVHRLDSRVKLVAAIVFSVFVIWLPATSVSILACYAVGPFAVLVVGKVPIRFALKQILLVSPFVLVLALSSLFYDKTPAEVAFGPLSWTVRSGLVRCFAICGKFVITMSVLIGLVATTRFSDLLAGMAKLGVPRLLVVQLGFLWRYIFLLIDRAYDILRARVGRKLRNLGFKTELKTAGAMVGTLCLGGLDTAGRINMAMQGRGFTGRLHTLSVMRLKTADWVFIAVFGLYLAGLCFLEGVF